MKFNLLLGNHNNTWGVSDYANLICNSLIQASQHLDSEIEIKVNGKLNPAGITLIIEEFSGIEFIEKIAAFKATYPHAKIWCFVTEVPTGNTFNNMAVPEAWKLITGLEMTLASKHTILSNRSMGLNYVGLAIKKLIIALGKTTEHAAYMAIRFHLFRALVDANMFNKLLVIHSGVKSSDIPIEYFPYVPYECLRAHNERYYWGAFYGTVTYARKLLINQFKKKGKIYVGEPNDGIREAVIANSKFSISLPRYKTWNFSSVTRNVHGLQYGAIPIISSKSKVIFDSFEIAIGLDKVVYEASEDVDRYNFFQKYHDVRSKRISCIANFLKTSLQEK